MATPRTIVVPAVKKQTATIICLHGLGDSGAGWSWLAENWRRRGKFQDVSFIFPSAPTIPITVNFGMSMPGWYDIVDFDTLSRSEDETGIMRSRSYIYGLIEEQVKQGIQPERIVLGGFSQGGAVSIFAGLTYQHRLAGVFGLSCYQLLPAKFDELRPQTETLQPPVFMGHGTADTRVKIEWGRLTKDGLKERGFKIEWKEISDLEHSADPEEIDALEAWVEDKLKSSNTAVHGPA